MMEKKKLRTTQREHNERRNGTYKIFSHRIIMYYFILRFGLTLWLLVVCECLCLCIDGDVVNVVASFSMCCYASSIRTRPFPPERVRSNALSCSIKLFELNEVEKNTESSSCICRFNARKKWKWWATQKKINKQRKKRECWMLVYVCVWVDLWVCTETTSTAASI